MAKYEMLWRYIASFGQEELALTFQEIEAVIGAPVNHGFLNCKKELEAYGYYVKKISLKAQTIQFERITEQMG